MKSVAVIIPCYYDYSELVKCINSVYSSQYNIRFFIFDNMPFNYGFAYGVNRGLEKALGAGATHFLILNADTELSPDTLDTLVEVIERTGWYLVSGNTGDPSRTLTEAVDGACVLISRKTIEDIGYLDEGYYLCGLDMEDYFMRIKQHQIGLEKKSMGKVGWATFTHYGDYVARNVEGFKEKYESTFYQNLSYFHYKWKLYPENADWKKEAFTLAYV